MLSRNRFTGKVPHIASDELTGIVSSAAAGRRSPPGSPVALCHSVERIEGEADHLVLPQDAVQLPEGTVILVGYRLSVGRRSFESCRGHRYFRRSFLRGGACQLVIDQGVLLAFGLRVGSIG